MKSITSDYQNGYLDEIMVYTPTGQIGVVEGAVTSATGWTTELTITLKNGATREGLRRDFAVADEKQRETYYG